MRSIKGSLLRLGLYGLAIVLVSSLFSAVAASNQIQATRLSVHREPITVNDFVPVECQSLNLLDFIIGSGNIRGTGRSELIVGSPGPDTITALNGDDCVLGGDGDDIIYGGNGNDVLMGGPGADTLSGDQGSDTCYGGAVFNGCESSFP